MTVIAPIEDVLSSTQAGVVCSTATGPGGLWLARRLGLPISGCDRAELRIEALHPDDPCTPTRWTRTFGRRSWTSTMAVGDGGNVMERLGPLTIHFDVDITADALVLRSTAVGLGPARWSGPSPIEVTATVTSAGDATMTTVEVDLRSFGHIRYVATMRDTSESTRS